MTVIGHIGHLASDVSNSVIVLAGKGREITDGLGAVCDSGVSLSNKIDPDSDMIEYLNLFKACADLAGLTVSGIVVPVAQIAGMGGDAACDLDEVFFQPLHDRMIN